MALQGALRWLISKMIYPVCPTPINRKQREIMGNPDTDQKSWRLVKSVHALARPLGTAAIIFGLIVLAGYFFHIELLYRPIAGGPATNPLTAISIILVSLEVRTSSRRKSDIRAQRLFAFLVILVLSIRILDSIFNTDFSTLITPFQDQVALEQQMGNNNSMGINSALMLFCIAIALALYSTKWMLSSQFIAFIAAAIPATSFTGYAYGLETFYGQMSPITATIGFMLALATLAKTANIGALRAILSPYIAGKIARLQIAAGYLMSTLLGFLLVRSLANENETLFGVFVVAICWFLIIMVSISAVFQENIDHKRRTGERLLAHAAMNDQLTGLPNRRKFFEFGQHELDRAKRTGNSLWLLMLDIDHFKKINDTAGHAMGDRILKTVGEVLTNSIREIDLVSRIGGEEFVVMLIDTNRLGAERVARNIRSNIEKTSIEGWTDTHGPVTTSVGCAATDGTLTLEQALKFADEALYQSKQNGRNQVSFSDQDTSTPAA